MPTSTPLNTQARGSALLLVLWSILLLSMAVFGVVEMMALSIGQASNHQLDLEAEGLAESGVALAENPSVGRNDPLLHQQWDGQHQFGVAVLSEAARLNLNFLLTNGHGPVLVNLFTYWGMDLLDADALVDALTDWVSSPVKATLNGAQDNAYIQAGLPQRPSHAPFQSLDEVDLVLGMDGLRKVRPDWQDYFTLWSDGPVNVNEANATVLMALCRVNLQQIQSFIVHRNGPDGVVGTEDDAPVQSLDQLQQYLGYTDLQMQTLTPLVVFSDQTRRIESVGQAGVRRVKISAVLRENTNPPEFYLWSEN